jgi:hypothetical protein
MRASPSACAVRRHRGAAGVEPARPRTDWQRTDELTWAKAVPPWWCDQGTVHFASEQGRGCGVVVGLGCTGGVRFRVSGSGAQRQRRLALLHPPSLPLSLPFLCVESARTLNPGPGPCPLLRSARAPRAVWRHLRGDPCRRGRAVEPLPGAGGGSHRRAAAVHAGGESLLAAAAAA